jgi:hypothetical protein
MYTTCYKYVIIILGSFYGLPSKIGKITYLYFILVRVRAIKALMNILGTYHGLIIKLIYMLQVKFNEKGVKNGFINCKYLSSN